MSPFRRRSRERRGSPPDLIAVGLGNPGQRYSGTRHNVGAAAVRLFADRIGARLRGQKGQLYESAEAVLDTKRLVLAVPRTFMNESGQAVSALCRRYGIADLGGLVIVHDELDLEPGRVQVKVGGGLAGHNGLRSIRDHLHDSSFVRVRIGVGKPSTPERGAEHVLRTPAGPEREALEAAVVTAADALGLILADGPEAAMNVINRR